MRTFKEAVFVACACIKFSHQALLYIDLFCTVLLAGISNLYNQIMGQGFPLGSFGDCLKPT